MSLPFRRARKVLPCIEPGRQPNREPGNLANCPLVFGPSLHRCTPLRAMRCNDVQCSATRCNASAGGYVQCVQRATTALRIGGRGWPGGYPTTLSLAGGAGQAAGSMGGLHALTPSAKGPGLMAKCAFFSGMRPPYASSFGWRRGVVRWENTRRSRSFGTPPIASLGARRPLTNHRRLNRIFEKIETEIDWMD